MNELLFTIVFVLFIRMNSSMQKGISALREAVEKTEDEIGRLYQYIPRAESIVTGSDGNKISSLPCDINTLQDNINDIEEKRMELRKIKEENDDIIDTYHQELCCVYESITENL